MEKILDKLWDLLGDIFTFGIWAIGVIIVGGIIFGLYESLEKMNQKSNSRKYLLSSTLFTNVMLIIIAIILSYGFYIIYDSLYEVDLSIQGLRY
tara:strand:+ start:472 stop:753 length:282 start_codon:yes stop_codon:yes gene_type:complete